MKNTPKYLDSNPCDKDWDKMKPEKNGSKRFCSSCSEFVHDLTQVDILEIYQNELKGKCINVNESQFQDLMFIHPLKRFAAAIFVVFGSSLFVIPENFGQEVDKVKYADSITIKGRVVNKSNMGIQMAKIEISYSRDKSLKYFTDENGEFEIKLTKNDLRYFEVSYKKNINFSI